MCSGASHPSGVAAGGNTPITAPSDSSARTPPSTVKATGGGDFCKLVAADINGALNQSDQTLPPAEMKKLVKQSEAQSQQAIDPAPSAIKADLERLLAYSKRSDAALAAANYDYTKLSPDASAGGLATPEGQATQARVLAYVKDHCGIDLVGGGASGGATTTTPADAASSAPPTTVGS